MAQNCNSLSLIPSAAIQNTEYLSSLSASSSHLRIDNGGLEYMCTCFYIFSDILAIHNSIWTYYISN